LLCKHEPSFQRFLPLLSRLMIPRISGNLLLARSNPRSIQKERMAVWSRGLHGAKALTIRFESAVLPTAKLLNWQRTSEFNKPEHWIFASSFKAGKKPWQPWRVQQRDISPAAVRCGIGRIGWHTFRHTFRSLLDETGAPLKVQQELMRHCHIRTTMNIYGKAIEKSNREADGKAVRLVLPSHVASCPLISSSFSYAVFSVQCSASAAARLPS